jgi:hypothetical protein
MNPMFRDDCGLKDGSGLLWRYATGNPDVEVRIVLGKLGCEFFSL